MKDTILMGVVIACSVGAGTVGWQWSNDGVSGKFIRAVFAFILVFGFLSQVFGNFMDPVKGGYDYPGEKIDRCDASRFCN